MTEGLPLIAARAEELESTAGEMRQTARKVRPCVAYLGAAGTHQAARS